MTSAAGAQVTRPRRWPADGVRGGLAGGAHRRADRVRQPLLRLHSRLWLWVPGRARGGSCCRCRELGSKALSRVWHPWEQ